MTFNFSSPFTLVVGTSLLLGLSSCGGVRVESSETSGANAIDKDVARQTAVEGLSEETFEDVGDTSTCTQDCSGHNAGFEWAKENDITDESECGGNSNSFIEGCEAYAQSIEERVEENQAESENDES